MNLKFLADVNIEVSIIDFLISENISVKCVRDVNKKMLDEHIIELARKEHRIILTNDKDFGELIFLRGENSDGILLFRIKGQSAEVKIILLKKLLREHPDKFNKYFTVVKKDKFRFIKLTEI